MELAALVRTRRLPTPLWAGAPYTQQKQFLIVPFLYYNYCLLNLSKYNPHRSPFFLPPDRNLWGVKKTTSLVVRQACCFPVLPSKSLRYVSSSAIRAANALASLPVSRLCRPSFSKAGAKLLLFFDMTKYFCKKIYFLCVFRAFLTVLRG